MMDASARFRRVLPPSRTASTTPWALIAGSCGGEQRRNNFSRKNFSKESCHADQSRRRLELRQEVLEQGHRRQQVLDLQRSRLAGRQAAIDGRPGVRRLGSRFCLEWRRRRERHIPQDRRRRDRRQTRPDRDLGRTGRLHALCLPLSDQGGHRLDRNTAGE